MLNFIFYPQFWIWRFGELFRQNAKSIEILYKFENL